MFYIFKYSTYMNIWNQQNNVDFVLCHCLDSTIATAPGHTRWTLTFLPRTFVHVGVASYHYNLNHEAVATLPDHVDDLPVTDLHHVLTIDLG